MLHPSLCIAGKNNIAVDVLEYVLKNNIYSKEEIVVVCNCTETGKNGWQKSLRYFAKLWDIREVTLEAVYAMEDICFLSLEFDRIIRPELFHTSNLYNIHFSKLPKYKGCYTAIMPILHGEVESGVTFHRMNSGIDTGEIIEQIIFPIDHNDTARDLYYKCLYHGTKLVIAQLRKLKENNGKLFGALQCAGYASYFAKDAINFKQLSINVKKTAVEISNQLRAFSFREYQLPVLNGKNVAGVEITDVPSVEKPGNIVWQDAWRGVMATIDYDIVVYWDAYEYVMKLVANGDTEKLFQVPKLSFYVNQGGQNGWTPLIIAAYHGFYDAFMLLVANGANLQQRNWNGTTLLMYAKDGWRKNGDTRIFAYLRKHGADLDEVDYRGKSLKDYCTKEELKILAKI